MLNSIHSEKAKRPRYEYISAAGNIPNTLPPYEKPAGSENTSILLTAAPSSSNNKRTTPHAKFHSLATRFKSSACAMASEADAISKLISGVGCHFQNYKQLLADVQSTTYEMERLCAEHSINEDILRQKSSGGLHCLSKLLCHSLPYTNGDSNAMTVMPKFNPHMHLKFTTEPPQKYPTPPDKHTQEQGKEQKIKHEHQQAPVKKCHSSVKLARQKPAASATKRPLSDFNFFCRDARKLVVEAHPEYTKEQVNKELGRIWSILDHSSRQYYREMYAQDKQRYSQDIATIADAELKKSPLSDKYSSFGDMPSSTAATVTALGQNSIKHSAGSQTLNNSCFNSAGSRVKRIIWQCVTTKTESDVRELPQSMPMQTSLANSVSGLVTPRPVYQNQNNIMCGSAQHHNKLPQFASSRSTYSSNTIKSILNESFDSACLDGVGDSDDIDEPLVHSLLRNSTHAAHIVKEHRMCETIGVSHTLAGAARQAAPTSDQLACANITLQVAAMISTPQESNASSADSLSDADSGI